jgi:glycosyltransferase involved in cell wall biosynthesis
MTRALQRQGCEISFFLQLKKQDTAFVRVKNRLTRMLTGRHIIHECDPKAVCHYPEQINAAVLKNPVQLVLGISPFYMAAPNCSVPSVFWGETTMAGVVDNHPFYKYLTKRNIKDFHNLEQAALSNCTLAVFSNQWAADSARASYRFDERKLRVIPYGANLINSLAQDEIEECICRRDITDWELLFVGVDWNRKGVEVAINTATILRTRGANVHLTLVGCTLPRTVNLPKYVTAIGEIDKTTQKGQTLLSALYMQSHLLILPSSVGCMSAPISEASAHGVPSLSTDVGGNRSLVKDGINGYLLPLEAGASDYADYAFQLLSDQSRYNAMCFSSFEQFKSELNWDVAVSRLIDELNNILELTDGQYACSRAS